MRASLTTNPTLAEALGWIFLLLDSTLLLLLR
jgi:hypothetical protein